VREDEREHHTYSVEPEIRIIADIWEWRMERENGKRSPEQQR
jgi:hypothetical protein